MAVSLEGKHYAIQKIFDMSGRGFYGSGICHISVRGDKGFDEPVFRRTIEDINYSFSGERT
jgi:hypothetical protein